MLFPRQTIRRCFRYALGILLPAYLLFADTRGVAQTAADDESQGLAEFDAGADAPLGEYVPSEAGGADERDASAPDEAGTPLQNTLDSGAIRARDGAVTAALDAGATADTYGAHARLERTTGPGEFEPYGTGSRMNIPLIELPNTVSVVDRAQLRERGIVDLNQALGLIAGVMPTWQYGGFQNIRVRGFQAMTLVDGRRDARALFADSAPQVGLYDLERIEVLRGPSSTLYGYGAVGGVVNMIRRRASSTPQYEAEAGLGLPHQMRAHVGAQGPVGDKLSYRVDLGHMDHENYRGERTDRNQASLGLRYAPNWRHTANLRVAYAFDKYNTDVGMPTVENPNRPGTWTLPPDARTSRRYATRNDHLNYQRIELSSDYRLQLNKDVHLDARGSVVRDSYDYLAAEGLTYLPPSDAADAQVDREYLGFQRGWLPAQGALELHADVTTGPLHHQLVFGYQLDSFRGKSYRGNQAGLEPGSVDFAYPVDNAPRLSTLQRTAYDLYRQLTHSVYGFDHMKLGHGVIVTGGARLDSVRTRTHRQFIDRSSGDAIPDPNTGAQRPWNRTKNLAITGQAGLLYTPITPITGYVSYASSFMPSFVYPAATEVTHYDPERGQQVEGGLRLRTVQRGHTLEADAALYFIDKSNVVIARGPDMYSQAGKVQSRGAEVRVSYRAPQYLQIDGNYALTVAEYKRFVTEDPVSGENVSRNGNQVDFAPRHSATGWLRLLLTKSMGVGVGSRVLGKQFGDPENRVPMPRFALLDASLWVGNERAQFTLSASNLLDQRAYFTSAINTFNVNPQLTPGPGREILGNLRLTL